MDEADAILSSAVDAYRAALGTRLVAAYALGSLAHGGFSALVSDVDLGLVLADPLQTSDGDVIHAITEAQKRTGSELAKRLSVFWGTASTLRGERDGGRFPPLDRLDLIEHGRLLFGVDTRRGLPRPTAAELLIAGAEFALESLAGRASDARHPVGGVEPLHAAPRDAIEQILNPDVLLARGVRDATKLVLFPVRFMFSAETARVATNDDAVGWYLGLAHVPAKTLVRTALAWRAEAPEDRTVAAEMLREQLVPLYLHYIRDHLDRLSPAGRPDLVRGFERWRDRLTRGADS